MASRSFNCVRGVLRDVVDCNVDAAQKVVEVSGLSSLYEARGDWAAHCLVRKKNLLRDDLMPNYQVGAATGVLHPMSKDGRRG